MKKIAFSLISLLFAFSLQAQTKVFKEVGEDISTEIKPITQDNALVGYLAFTRLEKADADSFNYRLTIMDENPLQASCTRSTKRIFTGWSTRTRRPTI
jgi:hypothetical protein